MEIILGAFMICFLHGKSKINQFKSITHIFLYIYNCIRHFMEMFCSSFIESEHLFCNHEHLYHCVAQWNQKTSVICVLNSTSQTQLVSIVSISDCNTF